MNEVKNLSKFDSYSRRMTVFARGSENHISVLTSAEMDIILFFEKRGFRLTFFIFRLQISFSDFRFSDYYLMPEYKFQITRLRINIIFGYGKNYAQTFHYQDIMFYTQIISFGYGKLLIIVY